MTKSPLAIIAGNGAFPLEAARRARASGAEVYAICHESETDPAIEQLVDRHVWLKVGQLRKLLRTLASWKPQQAIFIGGISRVKLFKNFLPDLSTLALIARLGSVRDDIFLRGVASEVERLGVEVVGSSQVLGDCVVTRGLLTKRGLTRAEAHDALLGWDAAKTLGSLDTGQTAVVSGGLIIALECIEGTDETIQRAGSLAAGKASVVVKTAKPHQDERLDLPAVGPGTLETMRQANASVLILEHERAMMLSPQDFVHRANELDMAVLVASARSELELLCS